MDRIADTVGRAQDGQVIVEIGPGFGALTRPLLQRGHVVYAIEVDTRFAPALADLSHGFPGQLAVVYDDALAYSFSSIPCHESCRIVSNLPYHIAGPLVARLVTLPLCRDGSSHLKNLRSLTLLLQKEMALRLVAPPSTKTYGRLSVLVQLLTRIAYVGTLKASLFQPRPKVDSALLHMRYEPNVGLRTNVLPFLRDLLLRAFSQRRKMLRSSIKAFLEPILKSPENMPKDWDGRKRAEDLSPEQFLALAIAGERLSSSSNTAHS